MKTLEKLLAEYKIRFKETEEIDEETYPFDPAYYDGCGENTSMIMPHTIDTNYGRVFRDGVWATAKITEKPKNWVVERNEQHPMWARFLEHIKLDGGSIDGKFINRKYHSSYYSGDDLLQFTNHQYLTLDQWAVLFLDEPKAGDWCVFWNEASCAWVVHKFGSIGEDGIRQFYIDKDGVYWCNCQKLSPELSAMLEKDINQIKGKE